jgi:hypothetical protein
MDLKTHLLSRYVNLDLHRPILDETEGVATFLLFNPSGQIVGYQQYRPGASKDQRNDPRDGRYFTRKNSQTVALFGVESLHLRTDVVFITEGIFDAVRLTGRGLPALAVLSNNPSKDVANFLLALGRKVITVCDNDPAGRKLARFGDQAVFTGSKDLGESSDEEIDELLTGLLLFH